MNSNELCMGCMKPRGEAEVCPECGWVEGSQLASPLYLTPRTELLNRYVIGRVLGHGGFGVTYIAWDKELELKVAIKEYLPDGLGTRALGESTVSVYSGQYGQDFEYGLEKFLAEARTLARFQNNSNIVSIVNYFKENGTAYIVMEYIEGISLKQYLQHKEGERLPLYEALTFIMPVADALSIVHAEGILHRDISPDNIYVTKDYQVKLLDFGASRQAISEANKSLSVLLKPGYAPVEQYSSKGSQGPWTDIYALAATLYKVITGKTPPESINRLQGMELETLASLGVDAPAGVETVLTKALAPQPRERYQTVNEFKADLDKALSVENIAMQTIDKKDIQTFINKEQETVKIKQQEVKSPVVQPGRPRPSIGKIHLGIIAGSLAGVVVIAAILFWIFAVPPITYNRANSAYSAEQFDKAWKLYLSAADKGNVKAIIKVGNGYLLGNTNMGVERDNKKAADYFQKAVDKNSALGRDLLGYIYLYGYNGKKDYEKAFELYAKGAEQGDIYAMCDLGYVYYNGHGVKKDMTLALKWLNKAGEGGSANALAALGDIYNYGLSVEKNVDKAKDYYSKARKAVDEYDAKHAKNGAPDLYDTVNLANRAQLYTKSILEKPNYAKAIQLYDQAQAMGNDFAAVALGNYYYQGIGVAPNPKKTFDYYLKAAKGGNEVAMNNVANLYQSGSGVNKDITQAVFWYKTSMDLGGYAPRVNLGFVYSEGKDITLNKAEADKLYKQALPLIEKDSANGLTDAMFWHGFVYMLGLGVDKDEQKALQLYKQAGEQGSIPALNQLAQISYDKRNYSDQFNYQLQAAQLDDVNSMISVAIAYVTGNGTTKNTNAGIEWLNRAIDAGSYAAMADLGYYYRSGDFGITKDETKANSLFKQAFAIVQEGANNDSGEAMWWLAYMYENGMGVPINEIESQKWAEKARAKGF